MSNMIRAKVTALLRQLRRSKKIMIHATKDVKDENVNLAIVLEVVLYFPNVIGLIHI